MKILIKQNEVWSLINAPASSINKLIESNDEVITEFTLTNEEESYIKKWVSFTYDNWLCTLAEHAELDEEEVNSETLEKALRLKTLYSEILSLWGKSNLISCDVLDTFREAQIESLVAEFNEIKADLENNYEESDITTLMTSLLT